jgi:hypothetical protein
VTHDHRTTPGVRYIVLGTHDTTRRWLRTNGVNDREAIVITRFTLHDIQRLVGLAGPVEVVRLPDYPSWLPDEHALVERHIRAVGAEPEDVTR